LQRAELRIPAFQISSLKKKKRSGNAIFLCAANVRTQCNIAELLFTRVSLTFFPLYYGSQTI